MTERKANPKKSVPPRGGGRKHAVKVSKITEAIAAAEGVMPKDVMLRAMRDLVDDADNTKSITQRRRLMRTAADIAKDVAPYVHPRLATVTHQGGDKPIEFTEVRRTIVRPGDVQRGGQGG